MSMPCLHSPIFFFFQAEDGIRDRDVTGVQTCALPISSVFPDSRVGAATAAPSDFPDGAEGMELTVEFTVLGRPFMGLNGGPNFKPNESVSLDRKSVVEGKGVGRGGGGRDRRWLGRAWV